MLMKFQQFLSTSIRQTHLSQWSNIEFAYTVKVTRDYMMKSQEKRNSTT